MRSREGRDRAHRHQAFGAEIQYARALGDELAQRRQDQRRPGNERGGENRRQDALFDDRPFASSRQRSV
jgi:hypothetical protein